MCASIPLAVAQIGAAVSACQRLQVRWRDACLFLRKLILHSARVRTGSASASASMNDIFVAAFAFNISLLDPADKLQTFVRNHLGDLLRFSCGAPILRSVLARLWALLLSPDELQHVLDILVRRNFLIAERRDYCVLRMHGLVYASLCMFVKKESIPAPQASTATTVNNHQPVASEQPSQSIGLDLNADLDDDDGTHCFCDSCFDMCRYRSNYANTTAIFFIFRNWCRPLFLRSTINY